VKKEKIKDAFVKNRRFYILLSLLIVVFTLGFFLVWQDRVLVKIGNQSITRSEYLEALNLWRGFYEATENNDILSDFDNTVLDILIEEKIIEYEAQRRNVDVTASMIEDRYQKLIEEYGSEQNLAYNAKNSYGWEIDDIKNTIRITILKEKLQPLILNHRIGRSISIQRGSGAPENAFLTKKFDEDSVDWINDIYSLVQVQGFDEIFDIFLSTQEKFEKVVIEGYEEWDSYENLALASNIAWSRNEIGVPDIDLEEFFAAHGNEPFLVMDSEAWRAIYVVDEIFSGDYDSWDSFLTEYKKANLNTNLYLWITGKMEVLFSRFHVSEVYADCSLCRGGSVNGRITDSITGQGLSGVSVNISTTYPGGSTCSYNEETNCWCGPKSKSTSTDGNGNYLFDRFDGLNCFANCGWGDGVAWQLSASRSGYNSNSRTFNPSNGGSVNISLAMAPICSCWCNTCNPPSCPSGTTENNTGLICKYGDLRNNCGYTCTPSGCGSASGCYSSVRSCWYVENSPAPTAPTAINIQVGGKTCDLGNSVRVPYPVYGNIYGFLARGATNYRASDPIRGRIPQLTYQYRFLSAVSSWLDTSTRYFPYISLNQGDSYSVSAQSKSANRCEGDALGGTISRDFVVNNIPRVISITPIGNPNDGVSGNINYDGSNNDFNCTVDNPKVFRVVFEDLDGCGDIWSGASANTNICGGVQARSLSLRAVRSGTSTLFASSNSPQNINCSGNRVTADFTLTFEGDENFLLDMQASVRDIVGDTSGWLQPFGAVWSYDGRRAELVIDSSAVVGVDRLNVNWTATDDVNTLSGVQSVRIYSRLNQGDILENLDDYSSIIYKDEGIDVHSNIGEYLLSWDSGMYSPAVSRANTSLSSSDMVDIGINQDGSLDFKIESVDRACNFMSEESRMTLGSPWIATRGGLVYSQGNINLAMKQSLYSDILGMYPDEQTALSTELASSGGTLPGDILGNQDYVYILESYINSNIKQWYEVLRRRALARDPDMFNWTEVTEITQEQLFVCENDSHVYFVDGNLTVNPNDYENLATSPEGISGCIFIVKGNITITEGDYKSVVNGSDYSVGYDILRGYFIADGDINIAFVDNDKDVRDGLKVIGGLFASGGNPSIRLGRSLQLRDNLLYPTLMIFHDARYFDIARHTLGDTFGGGHIRDIGLKE
jgi:hypothetical protein